MEEAREKKKMEIPLSKILKFRPNKRIFSHDEITIEEIQQNNILLLAVGCVMASVTT